MPISVIANQIRVQHYSFNLTAHLNESIQDQTEYIRTLESTIRIQNRALPEMTEEVNRYKTKAETQKAKISELEERVCSLATSFREFRNQIDSQAEMIVTAIEELRMEKEVKLDA